MSFLFFTAGLTGLIPNLSAPEQHFMRSTDPHQQVQIQPESKSETGQHEVIPGVFARKVSPKR